jgi:hypothetical protein
LFGFKAFFTQVKLGFDTIGRTAGGTKCGAVSALITKITDINDLKLLGYPQAFNFLDSDLFAVAYGLLNTNFNRIYRVGNIGPIGANRGANITEQVALQAASGRIAGSVGPPAWQILHPGFA